mmetsp:Transcript_37193/g.59748  ORF Transcript_37193/g.59748 Transcript_37193/m.59748 type:complete len:85 (-) Transcript_37193:237-491(-)
MSWLYNNTTKRSNFGESTRRRGSAPKLPGRKGTIENGGWAAFIAFNRVVWARVDDTTGGAVFGVFCLLVCSRLSSEPSWLELIQ